MEANTPPSNEKADLKDLLADVAATLGNGDGVGTTLFKDGSREIVISFDNSDEGLQAYEAICEFLAYCNNQYQFRSLEVAV